MTSDDNNKEWSCGTCTFLNKPLFLSCEMCGQDRPSQRPSPPRRQPSLPPQNDERVDRAPRSVQRHRSTVNITGTLIMTDDPNDYETQDGKKPGEDDEAEQDTGCLSYERPTREDDPTMDESMERHMLEPARHAGRTDSYGSGSRRSSHHHHRSYEGSAHAERRHTYQARDHHARDRDHHAPLPATTTRKSYTSSTGSTSGHTLPTAYMGSSSTRMHLEESNSFADDVSSLSSGRSGRYHHGSMSNSSRRLSGRPRLAAPQEIHYHGQSNGLPVISRDPPRYYTNQRQSSNSRLMTDSSANSHYSQDSSSRRGSSSRHLGVSSGSVRHLIPDTSSSHHRQRGGDYLPSLEPPPVPMVDSPGDVDAMAVFAKDAQAVNRRTGRKDRGQMLDNISRNNAFTSNRSLGTGSGISLASSTRRLQPTSQRGLSTRLLGDDYEEDTMSSSFHPSMLQDTEALDSPNTRRERRKERRRMKGAVRTLMATMKLASVTK